MKTMLLWILYNPVKGLLLCLPLAWLSVLPRVLGGLEYFFFGFFNQQFQAFMRQMVSATPLDGKARQLCRECFYYRSRHFLTRVCLGRPKGRLDDGSKVRLEQWAHQGIVFPVIHFGHFFNGFAILADRLKYPLYTLSVMPEKDGPLESQCLEDKKQMLRELGSHPVFDVGELKKVCLPAVVAGKAGYVPTFDAVTTRSSSYSLLGGEIILLIEPTARFALEHQVPLMPLFSLGDKNFNTLVTLAEPFIPSMVAESTLADVEDWYLKILEQQVLQNPGQVDWYFWWKNNLRFQALQS